MSLTGPYRLPYKRDVYCLISKTGNDRHFTLQVRKSVACVAGGMREQASGGGAALFQRPRAIACSRLSVVGDGEKGRARDKNEEGLSPPSFFPRSFSLFPNYREPGTAPPPHV